MTKYPNLFSSFENDSLSSKNRFVMAPMTRSRAIEPELIANDLMAKYYAQRAEAGLIISEATQVSLQGQGYSRTPGIYNKSQVEGWKLVTNAVHAKGGKMILQLWHVGRVSSAKVNTMQPIGPSAIAAKDTSVYIFDGAPNGDASFVDVDKPKEMTKEDIKQVINEFTIGAKNAIEAGFDGVEIHGANGYLIDQFLRCNANKRSDEYGGSTENRIRLLLEITDSVIAAVGKDKVGCRLSPFIKFKDMDDPKILETIMQASKDLNARGISYIHLCEADWDDAPSIPEDFRKELRESFKGIIIATGNKTPDEAEELIKKNLVDFVGFGRKFISNPDYPTRVAKGAELAEITEPHALFGVGTEKGYSDYPALG